MRLPRFLTERLAGMAKEYTSDFGIGWMEGTRRWKARGEDSFGSTVKGSEFVKGTVAFAASQAAVAFWEGMER